MTSMPRSQGDAFGDSEIQLAVGTAACVWNHYLRRWTGGFLAEVLDSGYRLRRLTDDHVFSHVFSIDEVMEERPTIRSRASQGIRLEPSFGRFR